MTRTTNTCLVTGVLAADLLGFAPLAAAESCLPRHSYEAAQLWIEERLTCRSGVPRQSSSIDRLTNCPTKDGWSFLIVETRSGGRAHLHEGVPAAVASAFASARSPGQYYDQQIRGAYRFRLAGDLPADHRETVCVP